MSEKLMVYSKTKKAIKKWPFTCNSYEMMVNKENRQT